MGSRQQWGIARLTADDHSDGIARVHGMANVQAEELVEYVGLSATCLVTRS
jgi:F0F1-type ATP synthase alpha subunit